MNKKECDIIKDLLPSYVDNICSEASKEWIEAHIAECEECRITSENLMNTEFSPKQLETAQIDATKKIKKKQVVNSMVNLGLCLFLAFMTVCILAEGNSVVSHLVLYAELPACMVITWFVNRGRQEKRSWDKWDTVSLLGVVLAIAYGIGMMYYVGYGSLSGKEVLALELGEVGPFLSMQLTGVAMLCLLVYVFQMIRLYRKGSTNIVTLCVCLIGIFLMLLYNVYLGNLSDAESAIEQLKKATFTVLEVGLISTALYVYLDKWGKEEKN